jgi:hypothetical protein
VDALLRRYFNRVTSRNDKGKEPNMNCVSTVGFLRPTRLDIVASGGLSRVEFVRTLKEGRWITTAARKARGSVRLFAIRKDGTLTGRASESLQSAFTA